MSEIQDVNIVENVEDAISWKFDKKGEFSVKSFCRAVMEHRTSIGGTLNVVHGFWKGLVPPRVEVITWFVVLQRINTKSRLNRLGMIPNDEIRCPFCGEEEESVSHLFLHCKYSWGLWT